MAEGIVQEYARKLLATGKDIARDLRRVGTEGIASAKQQQMRFSPQNVEATRGHNTRMVYDSGKMVEGVPEMYSQTTTSEFADDYFNNLPFVLDRDAAGYTVPSSERDRRPIILPLEQGLESGIAGDMDGTRIEFLAGEMLALSMKAAEGLASPEELELLDAYQQFMASRTGM